jgi:hypothetical protein
MSSRPGNADGGIKLGTTLAITISRTNVTVDKEQEMLFKSNILSAGKLDTRSSGLDVS